MVRTNYLEVFGASPVNKVLDFMARQGMDHSMSDIARLSGVSYSSLKVIWPKLSKHKIIRLTRKVGKAKLYVLDTKSPAVKSFLKFRDEFK
ncbi:hypothetical protein JW868_04170 [Candidatus Woesearchaeota archaeon]|nr:hypothetical protein [Candidatus Woesearchaeota archaeon]